MKPGTPAPSTAPVKPGAATATPAPVKPGTPVASATPAKPGTPAAGTAPQAGPAVLAPKPAPPMKPLVQRAREAVKQTFALNALNIEVTEQKGVVTLTGQVPGIAEKELATEVIRHLPGVKKIENKLVVL